ncbi:MAG: thiol reductase thioredoxin [Nitrospirae bacterium]|nr:thiol reductase thioredoxin [Nitrospirota bacterium]
MQTGSILLRCRSCHTLNRLPAGKLGLRPVCGKCKAPLDFPRTPVYAAASTFDREVNDWPMLLLVEFFAQWCGHCRAIEPVVNDIAARRAGSLKVLKVDVDREPALSSRFTVKGTPTFLLYRNGRLLGRIDGAPKSHSELEAWILQMSRT